jgi:glucose/arabinose dehydrogenase
MLLCVATAPGCYGGTPGLPEVTDASSHPTADAPSSYPDATYVEASDGASPTDPCSLPGSIQFTTNGVVVILGGGPSPDLSFLHVPVGFCVHYFGTVGNARQLRFAPGGELFVASPTTPTTSAGQGGQAAIVVLPDDDHDGTAEAPVTFLSGLPSTQGLLFANHQFYYQDGTKILTVPYAAGDRSPRARGTPAVDITAYVSTTHWPKTLDIADDGTIYVGNGGDQGEACDPARPFRGGVVKIDGTPGGSPVAKGFRNPIALRCARGKNTCFAIELGLDYSWDQRGHEKFVPIRAGDDWGFPCCATQGVPFGNVDPSVCTLMARDTNSFVIGDTPFGMDFEPGNWPAPWGGGALVVTHGAYGSWEGARIVAMAMDRSTQLMQPSTDVNGSSMVGQDQGAMIDFITGWADGTQSHGRPSAVTFSSDGRLFVANDQNGDIFWVAPMLP